MCTTRLLSLIVNSMYLTEWLPVNRMGGQSAITVPQHVTVQSVVGESGRQLDIRLSVALPL